MMTYEVTNTLRTNCYFISQHIAGSSFITLLIFIAIKYPSILRTENRFAITVPYQVIEKHQRSSKDPCYR